MTAVPFTICGFTRAADNFNIIEFDLADHFERITT